MRLQESPPIQPRRNHRDRAWSMLPALQALMYWLWTRRKRCPEAKGCDAASECQGRNRPWTGQPWEPPGRQSFPKSFPHEPVLTLWGLLQG